MKKERLTAEAVKNSLETSFAEFKYCHMLTTDELLISICALEKRVPNRPLRIKTPVLGKVKKGVCPECGNKVNEKQKCCSNCGQALDWEPPMFTFLNPALSKISEENSVEFTATISNGVDRK